MAMAQDTVERAQARNKLRPGARRCREVDERIDRGVLDADQVARAFDIGLIGGEARDQIGARRFVAGNADGEEIEVEHVEALLDEREVRAPVLTFDAELCERLEPRR